jgi:hypothetical protein
MPEKFEDVRRALIARRNQGRRQSSASELP